MDEGDRPLPLARGQPLDLRVRRYPRQLRPRGEGVEVGKELDRLAVDNRSGVAEIGGGVVPDPEERGWFDHSSI
jgi:hypothetical protein